MRSFLARHWLRLPLALLAAGSSLSAMDAGDSKLIFGDLRLGLGVDDGISKVDGESANGKTSPLATVTLMFGDIGSARQHEDGWADDLGIVLGPRFEAAHWKGDVGGDSSGRVGLEGYGIGAVGGLAWSFSSELHFELCAMYGIGSTSRESLRRFKLDTNGNYRWYGGELGTYWTWTSMLQVGFVLGYERDAIKAEPAVNADRASWTAGGPTASVSLGYRF